MPELLLRFIAIMDAASRDGVCVSDLEELALETRAHLYEQGLYKPDK